MRVLMITSEWPTRQHPGSVPFLVREVEQLQRLGIEVDVFPFRGRMHPGIYIKTWQQVQRRLLAQPYDLIHAQFGQSALPVLFPKNHPLVVTFRGSDLNGFVGSNGRHTFSGRLLRRLSQLVALRADEVILVSQQLAGSLPRRCYHVIPSGLDLALFRPLDKREARTRLSLDANERLVLFAGNIGNPIKRYQLAQAAVEKIDLPESVKLLVAMDVPPDRMPMYMNAADVLVLTSAHEGSPNVVKEALACNLPVVSVDVGDVRERLAGVEGCEVCADDRPDTIAAALGCALSRSAPVYGRRAVQHLEGGVLARQIFGVYRRALDRT